MAKAVPISPYIPRFVTRQDEEEGETRIDAFELADEVGPIVLLGEPGMGKTTLLETLAARSSDYRFVRASALSRDPELGAVGNRGRLLIDALDEVAAFKDGDALGRVLLALKRAGYPDFILSCRAADWQAVVGQSEILEDYGVLPRIWTLQPISEEDALENLCGQGSSRETAEAFLQGLRAKSLSDLSGNPLTLSLLVKLANRNGSALPESKTDLFREAVRVLRLERNHRRQASRLATLSESAALDAAGAASAALILTGAGLLSAIPQDVVEPDILDSDLVEDLPGGSCVRVILTSRLFRSIGPGGEGMFAPFHRTIAEYLGAVWLSRQIGQDKRKAARLLSLLNVDGQVPASLRGLHAWLAHNPLLCEHVIRADPYGVMQYGDADTLGHEAGKVLLAALKDLARDDPFFRSEDWASYTAKCLTHPELQEDIRALLRDPEAGYQLRSLLIETLHGSDIAKILEEDLKSIFLSPAHSYRERAEAVHVLAKAGLSAREWGGHIETLLLEPEDWGPRLAIDILVEVGIENFPAQTVAACILEDSGLGSGFNPGRRRRSSGLWRLRRVIPEHMAPAILDGVSLGLSIAREDEGRDDRSWSSWYELSGFLRRLVVETLDRETPDPIRFWKWIRPLNEREYVGVGDKDRIAEFLEQHDQFRRAIQTHILLDDTTDEILLSYFRLGRVSAGFEFQPEDVPTHLSWLNSKSELTDRDRAIWRELVRAAWQDDQLPDDVKKLADVGASRDEALDRFLNPDKYRPAGGDEVQKYERRQQERERREAARRAKVRQQYTDNRQALREGEFSWIANPGKAYLGRLGEVDSQQEPLQRLADWVGPDLLEDALAGLEAALGSADIPPPDKIAQGYAAGHYFHWIHPLLSGLNERVRTGRGLKDVSDPVLLSGWFGVHGELIGDSSGVSGLGAALGSEIQNRPGLMEACLRGWFEPHFDRGLEHVSGLYELARKPVDPALALGLMMEWLAKYAELPGSVEQELVSGLLRMGHAQMKAAREGLAEIVRSRLSSSHLNEARRRLWQAVGFLVIFEENEVWSGTHPDRDLIWSIRDRISFGRRAEGPSEELSAAQIVWVVETFRNFWPKEEHPEGTTRGDTNPWDASEFLVYLANRLASDASSESGVALVRLVEAEEDGYTNILKRARAAHRRLRIETAYRPPGLDAIRAAMEDTTPVSERDLRSVVLLALCDLQEEIRGNNTSTRRFFYTDAGHPRMENQCRDRLLRLLKFSYPIVSTPEEAMPEGKRSDAGFRLGSMRIPVEAKGQWHRHVWSAVTDQLDAFYTTDHESGGFGVYVVFWFGPDVPKARRLKTPPKPVPIPGTAHDMQRSLTSLIPPGRRDMISVFVLDLALPEKS